MTVKAEQANEHDDKQEDVGKKRDDVCHYNGLEVDHHTGAARRQPSMLELSEGLARARIV
jgi:hypothetical protein